MPFFTKLLSLLAESYFLRCSYECEENTFVPVHCKATRTHHYGPDSRQAQQVCGH